MQLTKEKKAGLKDRQDGARPKEKRRQIGQLRKDSETGSYVLFGIMSGLVLPSQFELLNLEITEWGIALQAAKGNQRKLLLSSLLPGTCVRKGSHTNSHNAAFHT